ncbi:MAG: DUF362 domain-containing protein [Desulfobacterales bacterium]|nr:DUF362 domain-containing protein [Desulfobacterales bacterium]
MGCVSVVRYEGAKSVAEAISLSGAFKNIKAGDRVFVKPNIVFWSHLVQMPPFGVITSTAVSEPVIRCLKDLGVKEIVVGESPMGTDPSISVSSYAFEALGYDAMKRRYGIKTLDILKGPFRDVELSGEVFGLSEAFCSADAVVSLPVLKTHAQTKVSLGIKNLKGCLDAKGRKRFHSSTLEKDLNHYVAFLAGVHPNTSVVTDGIYTLEKGPGFTGKARRSDLILASSDLLSADLVGASLLGFKPDEIAHLQKVCEARGVAAHGGWVETVGLKVEEEAKPHRWDFPYNQEMTLPAGMAKAGVSGLNFPKYDHSLCTHCSSIVGLLQFGLGAAYKGEPFDEVEVLTGKMHTPTPGKNHTILLGKCQVLKNRKHPHIKHPICVPGCPPDLKKLVAGVREAGIEMDENLFAHFDFAPALFMAPYEGRPEFSLEHFHHSSV